MKTVKINSKTKDRIIHYFEGAGMDYYAWSKSFNMHFGYYRWGMNPFNREALLNQMNEEVRRRLELEKMVDPLVLDLGCGLGTTSRYMARKNREAHFYALTITPWQVTYGKELTAEAGLSERIHHLEADYTDIPMPESTADAAFAIESACYATGNNKEDFLKEMHRVLRPGGRFVITDGFRKHSRPLPSWLDKIYRKNMECWALTEFADIKHFLDTAKKVGFKNLKVEDASWRVAPSFAHVPWVTLKFITKLLWKGEFFHLDRERRNNTLAPTLGMILGASRSHFSYYIISGEK